MGAEEAGFFFHESFISEVSLSCCRQCSMLHETMCALGIAFGTYQLLLTVILHWIGRVDTVSSSRPRRELRF